MEFDMASKWHDAVSAGFFLGRQLDIYIIIREFDVLGHFGHWKYEPEIDVKVRGFWFECRTIHGCI